MGVINDSESVNFPLIAKFDENPPQLAILQKLS